MIDFGHIAQALDREIPLSKRRGKTVSLAVRALTVADEAIRDANAVTLQVNPTQMETWRKMEARIDFLESTLREIELTLSVLPDPRRARMLAQKALEGK